MADVSELGRDYYGVFQLRGKLLNVQEATHQRIMQNADAEDSERKTNSRFATGEGV